VSGDIVRDAIGYWEPRRLWYNVALTVLTVAWVVFTWPHFRPAFTLASLGKLIVLAALANVCYSAAYLVDLPIQQSSFRDRWQRGRWVLWVLGTLFALAFTFYWIADEIYPYVSTS
jgi:hypothetical protein